jgi:outer membrane lipoprotein-sorting protein
MKMKMIKIKICILIALMLNPAVAQKAGKSLSGDKILAKTVEGFSFIRDFVVKIQIEVNMDRMQVPQMTSTMYYKEPDKVHFDSKGLLLVPREGINLNPRILAEKYDASFVGMDTVHGQSTYKLQLAAKGTQTKLRQLYAWVEPIHWTITRLETIPYEGRALVINFSYLNYRDNIWLPSRIAVIFNSAAGGERSGEDTASGQFPGFQRSMPRNGSVTIDYSDYKINIGLDDSIFNDQQRN